MIKVKSISQVSWRRMAGAGKYVLCVVFQTETLWSCFERVHQRRMLLCIVDLRKLSCKFSLVNWKYSGERGVTLAAKNSIDRTNSRMAENLQPSRAAVMVLYGFNAESYFRSEGISK